MALNLQLGDKFGDRSHCFLLPQSMVIFMSTSQIGASDVSPFGVMSRPQGCSQQCFHLSHYTIQNTMHVEMSHCFSQCQALREMRTWPWCMPGKATAYHQDMSLMVPRMSLVPDTQPGLHPGAQKKGCRGLKSSAAFPFAWLCPPCQVLVPRELTALLIAFVGWFGCGPQFWRLFPLVLPVTPDDAVAAAWGAAGDPGWESVSKVTAQPWPLQSCARALRGWLLLCAGTEPPAHGTCHCLALQKELRGLQPACCSQRGCCCVVQPLPSRASLYAWGRGCASPASAATGRAAFSPCPDFSWLRVVNGYRGAALQCFLTSGLSTSVS